MGLHGPRQTRPGAPLAPVDPVGPPTPVAPVAPVEPKPPVAPLFPVVPVAPVEPVAPEGGRLHVQSVPVLMKIWPGGQTCSFGVETWQAPMIAQRAGTRGRRTLTSDRTKGNCGKLTRLFKRVHDRVEALEQRPRESRETSEGSHAVSGRQRPPARAWDAEGIGAGLQPSHTRPFQLSRALVWPHHSGNGIRRYLPRAFMWGSYIARSACSFASISGPSRTISPASRSD